MSVTTGKDPELSLTLHGLYDFKAVFDDNTIADGAVSYNSKYEEVMVKMDNSWFFIEHGDDAREIESTLYKAIRDKVATCKDAEKTDLLNQVVIEYSLVVKGDDKTCNVIGFNVLDPTIKKAPKASKEEYMVNENFGEF